MPQVNHNILRWARETAGLAPAEAVAKLQIGDARGVAAVDRLAALEAGSVPPTRPMLLKMAKQYRRPLLTFYLSVPPRVGDRGKDFRTLSDEYTETDHARLDALLRDVHARQSLVRAVLEDDDDVKPLDFIDSVRVSDGVDAVLGSIRQHLDLPLSEFRAQADATQAFKLLRKHIEHLDVFVLLIGDLGSHHTRIPAEMFRGFALADNLAPFVVVNNQDSRAAWSFTLLHELTHLWLGQTAISGGPAERRVERFCNDVASEFLLPREELRDLALESTADLDEVETRIHEFAAPRNVSRSMIAYRLYRQRTIDRATWQKLGERFRARWEAERKRQKLRTQQRPGSPDYYVVRRFRLGTALIEFVAATMAAGALPTSKAAHVLGVKAKQVQSLLDR